jgi:hypothetical protein
MGEAAHSGPSSVLGAGGYALHVKYSVPFLDNCMYVCIRGGLLQPLHLDPQWSIVLNPYDR